MATPKASPAKKAERKKPVRKSPALKDFPNRLAWLKAMTEYEEAQAKSTDEAKVARLTKRIGAKQKQVDELTAEVAKLEAERDALEGNEPEELIDGMTDEEHLAAEGKA